MLETTRLFLRRFNENDIDPVFAMRRDADIMRFIRPVQINRAETRDWIELVSSRWAGEKIGFCAVVEKASNDFVGWCGLWRLAETGEIEVGYAFRKQFWNMGFAAEAAEAVLRYGFGELALEKIVAVADPENAASRRVMEKLGMRFDYTGKFYKRDLVHYSVTKAEWENRAADFADAAKRE